MREIFESCNSHLQLYQNVSFKVQSFGEVKFWLVKIIVVVFDCGIYLAAFMHDLMIHYDDGDDLIRSLSCRNCLGAMHPSFRAMNERQTQSAASKCIKS